MGTLANLGLAPIVSAAVGDLYVSDFDNGVVLRFNATGQSSVFASGLDSPFGLAFDRHGNLFVADGNTILRFTPQGARTTFAANLNLPTALAFDAAGNLFAANFSGNSILKFTPDGSQTTFASQLNNPSGLVFDGAGNLFASDYGSGQMFEFTPTGTKTTFTSGLARPEEIVFDASGHLFVATFTDGKIHKFTPAGSETTFASGLSGSWGLALAPDGRLFEADSTSGSILSFTPDGMRTTFATGIGVPTFLAFEPPTGLLLNISTRMPVLPGDDAVICGFIITGTDPKKLILRGMGPSLDRLGVPGALSDPILELHDSTGAAITTNDNWKDTQQAEIEATGIPPGNDLESSIVATLAPGAYTAIERGKAGTSGVGLVEVYDLDNPIVSTLANISTRGFVETEGNVMIGGFIVGAGNGVTIIVRAIGPSLAGAGITNALADPTLELHDGNGALVRANDNWKETQEGEIRATTIPPTDDLESAIVATLVPGAYTAIVAGKGGTTGVGLVEVFNLR